MFVSTNASKRKSRFRWWLWIPLSFVAISKWHIALPTVTVHYPAEGWREFRYIWNVQHRIYKGGMLPGDGAIDWGHLFPDDKFFMEFAWWSKMGGRNHCVSITPKWPHTDIYLDVWGNIDTREASGTHTDRLKECEFDSAKP